MENGVWRTVGGRRIFIKDGQSLSDAMKESGKFKKGEKYKNKNGAKIEIDDYTKDGQPQYKDNSGEIRKASDDESLKRILDDNGYAKQEDYKPSDDEIGFNPREAVDYYLKKGDFDKADELIDDYALEDEREEFIDGLNSKAAAEYKKYRNSKDMIEKYMNIPEEERVKAAEEGKNWKDLVKEKEKSELHKKLEKDMGEELVEHTNDKGDKWYSSKSLDDEEKEFRDKYEKESSTKDIKVSGPDSDMIIEDFEDKVLSNYDEPLTQSEKKQQIDKFVQKYQAQGEPMKNISTQDMKEVLYDNYKIQDDSNKTMNDSIREKAEKTNAKKEEAKTYMQDQYKAFDKGDISGAELEQAKKDSGLSKQEIEEARRYVNDRAPESYPRATENKTGNTTSQAVPKASKTTEQDTLTNEYNKTDSRGSMSDDAFIEQARKVGMSDENIAKEVYKKHNGPESNNTSDNNIKRLLAKQKKEESLAKGDKDTANRFEKYEKEFESRIKASESSNEEKRIPGTKMKTTDEKDQKRAMYSAIQNDTNRRYDKKEISREERNKIIDDAHDKYIKEKETKGNSQINDTIRKKAYQKYLKEHPGSKMKFEDFIK